MRKPYGPVAKPALDTTVPSRVYLRETHPNLYRALTIIALVFVALGFNFLLTTPTFQQYEIPKNYIGAGTKSERR